MKWNPEWNTGASVVTFGKAAGLAIILAGVGLSAWNALDLDAVGFRGATEYKIRFFLSSVLVYLGSGGLLILAAEIADRLGWGEEELDEEGTAE